MRQRAGRRARVRLVPRGRLALVAWSCLCTHLAHARIVTRRAPSALLRRVLAAKFFAWLGGALLTAAPCRNPVWDITLRGRVVSRRGPPPLDVGGRPPRGCSAIPAGRGGIRPGASTRRRTSPPLTGVLLERRPHVQDQCPRGPRPTGVPRTARRPLRLLVALPPPRAEPPVNRRRLAPPLRRQRPCRRPCPCSRRRERHCRRRGGRARGAGHAGARAGSRRAYHEYQHTTTTRAWWPEPNGGRSRCTQHGHMPAVLARHAPSRQSWGAGRTKTP